MLWHGTRRLPCSAFNYEGRVQQAEIMGIKRLALVEQIRDRQVVRKQKQLASPKVTRREKCLLQKAAARAAEIPSSSRAPNTTSVLSERTRRSTLRRQKRPGASSIEIRAVARPRGASALQSRRTL